MSNDNEAEQLRKAQQHLGPILRFIANQPVGVPPLTAYATAPHIALPIGHDASAIAASSAALQLQIQAAAAAASAAGSASHHASSSASAAGSLKQMITVPSSTTAVPVSLSPAATGYAPAGSFYHLPVSQGSLATGGVSMETAGGTGTSQTVASSTQAPASHTATSSSSSATMRSGEESQSRKLSLVANQASVDNESGDEDEEDAMVGATSTTPMSSIRKTDLRRSQHTTAEQKRRDDIKHGFESLAMLMPSCQSNSNNGQKLSKANILERSIDYLGYLKKNRKQQEQDLVALRNEVVALRIMKRNYEQIAKAHHSLPPEKAPQVSDAAKFEVFKAIMDTLFQSFDACISVNTFEALSSSIFQWLEEFCKPQNMRSIVISSLQTLQKQPAGSMYGQS